MPTTTPPETIGERLVKARKAKGLSPGAAAKALGHGTRVQLSRWENDRVVPGSDSLARLATLYGVTQDWIMRGTGASPINTNVSQDKSPNDALVNIGSLAARIVAAESNAAGDVLADRVAPLIAAMYGEIRRWAPSYTEEEVYGFAYITLRKEQRERSPEVPSAKPASRRGRNG